MKLSSAECFLYAGTVLRAQDTTKHDTVPALKKFCLLGITGRKTGNFFAV